MKSTERQIIGELILNLIEHGFRIEVSESDGGGLFVYAAPDGGEKPKDGYSYWVRLVEGNGCDIISDFSTSTERYIKGALDLADTLAMEK
jgi:hypothetical protein